MPNRIVSLIDILFLKYFALLTDGSKILSRDKNKHCRTEIVRQHKAISIIVCQTSTDTGSLQGQLPGYGLAVPGNKGTIVPHGHTIHNLQQLLHRPLLAEQLFRLHILQSHRKTCTILRTPCIY